MSQRKSNAVDTIAVVALLLFLAVACFGGFAFWQYSRVRSVQAEMLRLEAMKAHEQALLQARFAMEEAVKKAADDAGGAVEQAEKVDRRGCIGKHALPTQHCALRIVSSSVTRVIP